MRITLQCSQIPPRLKITPLENVEYDAVVYLLKSAAVAQFSHVIFFRRSAA